MRPPSRLHRRTAIGGAVAGAALTGIVPRAIAVPRRARTAVRNGIIDVHAHAILPAWRAALDRHRVRTASGLQIPRWSPDAAVDFMDRRGVAVQMLSIPEPALAFIDDAGERAALARRLNNQLADLVYDKRYRGRFGAFAVLPIGPKPGLADVVAAIAETQRALGSLGLDGVGLLSNYGQTYLGNPLFEPLMADLDTRQARVFLHGNVRGTQPHPPHAPYLLEGLFNTARAVVSMSYLQTFTLHQQIAWICADGGGVLPYLAYRTSLLELYPAIAQNLGIGDLDDQNFDYGRLHYDTAVCGSHAGIPALRTLLEVTGVDGILTGTDWPFSRATLPPRGLQPGPDAFLGRAQLDAVRRTNALALFPTLASRI